MKILLSILFTITARWASAAEETSSHRLMYLHKGTMQIGGSFSWSYTTFRDSESISHYSIAPSLEYFVTDNLSLGGSIAYFGQTGQYAYTGYDIGPSGSFYFFQQDRWAAHISQAISWTRYSGISETSSRGTSSIGIKYFTTPNVAFGIALSQSYDLTGKSTYPNSTIIGGNFSFYY